MNLSCLQKKIMDPFQIRSLIKAGFSSLMPVRDIVPIFLFCIFLGIRMETCRLSVYRENQRIGTKFERKDFLPEIFSVHNRPKRLTDDSRIDQATDGRDHGTAEGRSKIFEIEFSYVVL